jgi:hypothetical protein
LRGEKGRGSGWEGLEPAYEGVEEGWIGEDGFCFRSVQLAIHGSTPPVSAYLLHLIALQHLLRDTVRCLTLAHSEDDNIGISGGGNGLCSRRIRGILLFRLSGSFGGFWGSSTSL